MNLSSIRGIPQRLIELAFITPVFNFILFFFLFYSINTNAQCGIQDTITILDNDTTFIQLEISGLISDDLSSVQQCLEQVHLEFEHQSIGDLEVILISPAGESVLLMGPVGFFAPTDFVTWNVSFTDCFSLASPDIGFSNTWNNNQSWSAFTTYSGTYYPFSGCLSQFDQGSGNGIWTLMIIDHFPSDIGQILQLALSFCDPSGLDCYICEANGGQLDHGNLNLCLGDPDLNIELNVVYNDDEPDPLSYGYQYILSSNDQILDYVINPDLAGFPVGNYLICGLSYLFSDSILIPAPGSATLDDLMNGLNNISPIFCGDISDNCVSVQINEIPLLSMVDTFICNGGVLLYYDSIYYQPGQYAQTIQTVHGCDSSVLLNVSSFDVQAFIDSPDTLDCLNQTVLIDGSNSLAFGDVQYEWTTADGFIIGPDNQATVLAGKSGIYQLIISSLGCSDTSAIQVFADDTAPQLIPQYSNIGCNQSQTILNLEIIGDFSEIEWVGPDNFNSNLENPIVTTPGIYTGTVTAQNGCESSIDINVSIDTLPPSVNLILEDIQCPGTAGFVFLQLSDIVNTDFAWSGPGGFFSTNDSIFPVIPGDYTVQINPQNGCLVFIDTNITILYDNPQFQMNVDTLHCDVTFVQPDVIPLQTDYSYSWNGPNGYIASGIDPQFVQSGIYYVTVTNPFGCNTVDSIEVFADPDRPDLVVSDIVFPCGAQNVMLIASSSTPDVSFSWTGPGNFTSNLPNPTVNVIGDYIIEVKKLSGCAKIDTIEVIPDQNGFTLEIQSENLGCELDSVQLHLNSIPNLSYNWSGPNQFSSNIAEPFVDIAGVYTLEAIDTLSGCSLVFAYTLIEQTAALPFTLSATEINCITPNASITFQSDNSQPEGYLWTGPFAFSADSASIVVDHPGVYTLIVTDSITGCIRVDSIEVIADLEKPVFDIAAGVFGCFNNSVIIEVENFDLNSSIMWTGPSSFVSQDAQIEVFDSGPYKFLIIGTNGCKDSLSVIPETDLTVPDINIQGQSITCLDTLADMFVSSTSPSTIFEWTGPNNFVFTNNNPSVSVSGTYIVTAIADNTCESIDSIFISDNRIFPSMSVSSDTITCNEPEATIFVISDIGQTFDWIGEDNTTFNGDTIHVQNPGNYYLTVTSFEGCRSIDTVFVEIDTVLPIFDFLPPDIITCANDTIGIQIDSDFPGYQYEWTGPNGYFSEQIVPDIYEEGKYTLTIYNSSFCISSKDIIVESDLAIPMINIVGDTLTCAQGKVQIITETQDPISSFSWSGPGNFSTFDQNPYVELPGFYELIAEGTNGCQTAQVIHIPIDNIPPIISVIDGALSCLDSTAVLNVESIQSDLEFRWLGPNNFESTLQDPMVTEAGVYYIIATAQNGCVTIDSVLIKNEPIYPEFSYNLTGDITCAVDSVLIILSIDVNPTSINWSGPYAFTSNSANIYAHDPGLYFVEVTYEENGCKRDTSINVEEDILAPIAVAFQSTPLYCDNQIIQISGTGSTNGDTIQYRWSTIDGFIIDEINTIQTMIQGSGTYILEVKNIINGCSSYDTVFVNFDDIPDIDLDLEVISPNCVDPNSGAILISNISGPEGPFLYSIYDGFFQSEDEFFNLSAGNYQLLIKDKYGCIHEKEVELEAKNPLEVNLGPDLIVNIGDSVLIEAAFNKPKDSIKSLQLLDDKGLHCVDCFKYTFEVVEDLVFVAHAEDKNGCIDIDTLKITVNLLDDVFVPNIFTPNGDGINDILFVQANSKVNKINRFIIFDRWGNLVFELKDFEPNISSLGWKGYNKDKYYVPQVFAYLVEYELKGGTKVKKFGDFTLYK